MKQQNLFTEEGAGADKPVNVSSVRQLSPFRYAGGKTWFVPRFRQWMKSFDKVPSLLVEPFAGGGIVSLSAAAEGMAKEVLMVEKDPEVAAVWDTIINGDGEWLANRIVRFEMTIENATEELARKPDNVQELAFQTIIKNRTYHGGILAQGSGMLKHGENGKGILSRWYPATLAKRIREIGLIKAKIRFVQGDAFEVMKEHSDSKTATFFIDPPYTAGGKKAGSRLYTYWQIDHDQLFTTCEALSGQFLLTYDIAQEVKDLSAKHGFVTREIPMKNTHHAEMAELLISKDLSWV